MPIYRDLKRIPLLVLPDKTRHASTPTEPMPTDALARTQQSPLGGATTNCSPGLPQSRNGSPTCGSGSLSHNAPQGECPNPSAGASEEDCGTSNTCKAFLTIPADSEPHLLIISWMEWMTEVSTAMFQATPQEEYHMDVKRKQNLTMKITTSYVLLQATSSFPCSFSFLKLQLH